MRQLLARLLLAASYRLEPPEEPAPPPEAAPPDDSVQRELDAVLARQERLAAAAHVVAQGNLAREVDGSDALAGAFKQMVAGLRRLVGQVKDATLDVDRGAQDVGTAIRTANDSVTHVENAIAIIAHGASEQMTQVNAAAEAIGNVSNEVNRVADVATELAASSQSARQAADRGAAAVSSTVHGMRAIADSSAAAAERVRDLDALAQQIGAVVATIDSIAEQTNLLALNAAIEAARAGEQGRGFAVVAGEVRKLAERSRRETQQIGELIDRIQSASTEMARQIMADAEAAQQQRGRADQAADALTEIINAVEAAAQHVSGISGSAHVASEGTRALAELIQPVRSVAEANAEATRAMTERVREAATAMDQANASVDELTATAERLRQTIAHFQLTEARRQSVDIAVVARSSAWPNERNARIVDLSATGARIDGLEAEVGTELDLSFTPAPGERPVRRQGKVMRILASDSGPSIGVAFVADPSRAARRPAA